MSLNDDKPRVAITGAGVISSLGQGISLLAKSLLNGENKFIRSARFPNLPFSVIAAELKGFIFEEALKQYPALPDNLLMSAYKAGRRAPLVVQTSLIAALEAWQQAKLAERNIESTRIGLVIAGQNTTQAYQHNLQAAFQQEPSYLSPTYALHFMDTDQVGTLSEVFGIHGEGLTVGGASASGNVAIIQGQRLIQHGHIDVCLVVGVLADLSPMELQGFYNIGALGGRRFHEEACDRDHEGFIWGQASGSLLLESTEKAQKAGVPLLGEIRGSAMLLDGNRLTHSNLQGEMRVMQQALKNAHISSNDIDYMNAHGSSSVLGDEVEITAIRSVFGEATGQLWLNATKGLLGHCLWSAGIVEAIATLLQLQGGFVHANRNLENPIDDEIRFVPQHSETANIQTAMSNSFGFGGINTSIIFTRGDR